MHWRARACGWPGSRGVRLAGGGVRLAREVPRRGLSAIEGVWVKCLVVLRGVVHAFIAGRGGGEGEKEVKQDQWGLAPTLVVRHPLHGDGCFPPWWCATLSTVTCASRTLWCATLSTRG